MPYGRSALKVEGVKVTSGRSKQIKNQAKSKTMKGNLYAIPEVPEILSAIAQPMYDRTPSPPHITLGYNIDEDSVAVDSNGLVFSAPVTAHCWNQHAQALKVILPAGIPWLANKESIPHITLSWPMGSAPVKAGSMLKCRCYEEVVFPEPIFVLFRIEFVPYIDREQQF